MKLASLISAAAIGLAHQAAAAVETEVKAEAKPVVDKIKAKATDLFAELLSLAETSFASAATAEVTDLAGDKLDQAIASIQAGVTAAVQHVVGEPQAA